MNIGQPYSMRRLLIVYGAVVFGTLLGVVVGNLLKG